MNKNIKHLMPIAISFLLASCDFSFSQANVSNNEKEGIINKLARSNENISLVAGLTEEEIIDEVEPVIENDEDNSNVSKIDSLLSKYAELNSPNLYSVASVESSNEDYSYALVVTYKDSTINVFFNEIISEEEESIEEPSVDDIDEYDDEFNEENEQRFRGHHNHGHRNDDDSVRYSGIIVIGDVEANFYGKRIVKDDSTYTKLRAELEDENRLTFESYVDSNSVTFTYQISKGFDVSNALYYQNLKVDNGNEITFSIYSESGFEFYTFSTLNVNASSYIEVTYMDDYGYGVYQVLSDGIDFVVRVIDEVTYDFVDDDDDKFDDYDDEDCDFDDWDDYYDDHNDHHGCDYDAEDYYDWHEQDYGHGNHEGHNNDNHGNHHHHDHNDFDEEDYDDFDDYDEEEYDDFFGDKDIDDMTDEELEEWLEYLEQYFGTDDDNDENDDAEDAESEQVDEE